MNIVALIVGAIGLWGCYASRGMRDAKCDDSHPGATEPHIPHEAVERIER